MADDPTSIQPTISRELSDLADAALEGALAIARHETEGSEHVRFTIIGMGKLGAQELNYVSDVDLIYVVEPADKDVDHQTLIRVGTKMGTMLQRVCQSAIMGVAEQPLWQIDGGLRPEGKDGALVRVLSSHKNYYEQWAENWEFQALLKARPVAGDPDLGQAYMDMTRPFVWSASKRKNFVYDCQKMRKRVEDLIPAPLRTARLSSAAAVCAMWNSPCRCSSSYTAAPTNRCAPATRSTRCSACPKAAMSRASRPCACPRTTASSA